MPHPDDIAIPKRLFEITAAIAEVYDRIDETGDLESTIDALEMAQAEKAGNILALIQRAEADEDAAMKFAEYFKKKSDTRKALVARLKKFVMDYMTLNGLKSLQTDRGMKFAIQPNGGLKPITVDGRPLAEVAFQFGKLSGYFISETHLVGDTPVTGVALVPIPDKYVTAKTTYQLNTDAIREDLDNGTVQADFAYGERGQHIRIK